MTRFKPGSGASVDALALTLIKLVTIGLGFVVTRLLSQHLSAYAYGTYSQILLIVSTVSSLTILGMMDGVNYFFCSEQDVQRREAYIATLFAMQCAVGVLAGSFVMLLQNRICAGFGNPEIKSLLVFAAVLPLLQNLVSMLQIMMVSAGKARIIAVRNLVVSLIKLAAVAVVVLLVQNVALIMAVTVLMDLGQIAVFLVILRKNGCLIPIRRTDFRLSRQILSYCLPMAVFISLNTLNRDCDKYLIALLTDTETLAMYANASKPLPFDIIMTSFCTVLLPEITRLVSAKEHEQAISLYRLFLEIAFISTTILCGAALTAAPQLMELLYSEKYIGGLPVFCIYILVDMIRFTNITLILSAAGKTGRLMLLSMGAFAGNLMLNLLLFRWFGTPGPAAATLAMTAVVGWAMLYLSAKEMGSSIWDFFDIRYLALFMAENAAALILLSTLRRYLQCRGIHYFVILLVVGLAYGTGLLLLNGRRLYRDLKYVNGRSGNRR